jgi:mitochondrial import receptor subunit TOM70
MSSRLSSSNLPQTVTIDSSPLASPSSSSVWERFSKWASENKALVYTIAGIAVVVTSAGVVYYLSDASHSAEGATVSTEKRKSKKERRKEKKKAEDEKKAKEEKTASAPVG